MNRRRLLSATIVVACLASALGSPALADPPPLTMVIMDPLAAPLSCPCVEGYAQRKYEVLAQYLEKQTGEKVQVVYSEALSTALKKKTQGRADIIIGKDSVVRADAKEAKLKTTPIGRLTGLEGKTTQTGLIIVRTDSAAKTAKDLQGYDIFFGPPECDEKHAAAIALLKTLKVHLPKKLSIDKSCSDGAAKLVEQGASKKSAAVISSYAAPLLEGCGTIKKGDLRVIGKTKPVPFITAFTTQSVSAKRRERITKALLAAEEDPDVLIALESLIGFTPIEQKKPAAAITAEKKK